LSFWVIKSAASKGEMT